MPLPHRRAARRAPILRLVGMISSALLLMFLGSSLLLLLFLVALRTSATFRAWERRFNKRTLNPAVLRRAGHPRSLYAVIHHIGRRSGRTYATPVRVRSTPEGFILPLPYGPEVDWLRNVLATGGGIISWRGQDYPVGEPAVMNMATALTRVPLPRWRVWLWRGLLTRSPLGAVPCVWLKRLASVPASANAGCRAVSTVAAVAYRPSDQPG
jgi:hypothetical protein